MRQHCLSEASQPHIQVAPQLSYTLTDRLFKDVVSESVLSVNSVLDNPKDFGITDYKYTLGDVTKAESDKSTALMQDYLTDFKQINSEELSDKDKIVYDIITTDLDESIDFSKYYLYTDYLSPLYCHQKELLHPLHLQ